MTLDFYDTVAQKSLTRTVILQNEAEDKDDKTNNARTFTYISKSDSDNPLSQIINESGDSGSFVTGIDIDEDGGLDIVLQKFDEDTLEPKLMLLYNSVKTDAFFMKALMVNSP